MARYDCLKKIMKLFGIKQIVVRLLIRMATSPIEILSEEESPIVMKLTFKLLSNGFIRVDYLVTSFAKIKARIYRLVRVMLFQTFNPIVCNCWNGRDMNLGDTLVKLYPKLLRYALSLTRKKDLAEDLVMDVVTRLLERADQIDDDINIESYAIRSVKNRFIDNHRYQMRMVTESSMSSDEGNFFDGIADARAELATTSTLEYRDLSRALSATGQDCLEILTLFGVGSSYKEIAERLDTAIGTVMSRMARCRTKLKYQLEEAA